MSGAELRGGFESLLFKWAGVEGVSTTGRGEHVDGRHVAFLEKFFGSSIQQTLGNTVSANPNAAHSVALEKAFNTIVSGLLTRTLSTAAVTIVLTSGKVLEALESPYFQLIGLRYDPETDAYHGSATRVIDAVIKNASGPPAQKLAYFDQQIVALSGLKYEFFDDSAVQYRAAIEDGLGHIQDAALRQYVLALLDKPVTAGTASENAITGNASAEMVWSKGGNDLVKGGDGNDTYVWARGDDNDTFNDSSLWGGNADRLLLVGVNPDDVSFERGPGDTIIVVIAPSAPGGSNGGRIAIVDAISTWHDAGIERIVLADGTVWTKAELTSVILEKARTASDDVIQGFHNFDDMIDGGAGNDTLIGDNGNDTLRGGLDDDILRGGEGNDTYVYARGHGNYTLIDNYVAGGTADKLRFTDINVSDVRFSRDGNNVILIVDPSTPGGSDGGRIVLTYTLGVYHESGIGLVQFADGTMLDRDALRAKVFAALQTAGDDVIVGSNANDTFFWSRGDGNDTFDDSGVFGGTADRLRLVGVDPDDVRFDYDGSNHVTLVVAPSTPSGADGRRITLTSALSDYWETGIERIVFDDGTVWQKADLPSLIIDRYSTSGDDVIQGTRYDDTIDGGAGNDTIRGAEGNDTIKGGLGDDILRGDEGNDTYTYVRGDGDDTIVDSSAWGGDADTLRLIGIDPLDVSRERVAGNDDVLVIAPSTPGGADGARLTLTGGIVNFFDAGIERTVFDGGTIWTKADLLSLPSTLRGTARADTIWGTDGDDLFIGGGGNDVLRSGAGSDTFHYASGDGSDFLDEESGATAYVDTLVFTDLNADDVSLRKSGNDLLVTVTATNHVIELDEQFYSPTQHWGIDRIEFADDTVWDRSDLDAILLAPNYVHGTASAETLWGTDGNDIFIGGVGSDVLRSGVGSDTFRYPSGDGSDFLDEESGSTAEVDILVFTDLDADDVSLTKSGNDLLVTVTATNHVIELDEQYWSPTQHWGIDKMTFADGTIWNPSQIDDHLVT